MPPSGMSKGSQWATLREDEPAFGRGDLPPQLPRGLDPLARDDAQIRQGLFVRRAVGRAARQLGHFGDEGVVLLAPVDDHLVLYAVVHRSSSSASRYRRMM